LRAGNGLANPAGAIARGDIRSPHPELVEGRKIDVRPLLEAVSGTTAPPPVR
jgi:hypothetical protein